MLIDFGIARWVNKLEKGVTACSASMGYAATERVSAAGPIRAVDIYSLGATMFSSADRIRPARQIRC